LWARAAKFQFCGLVGLVPQRSWASASASGNRLARRAASKQRPADDVALRSAAAKVERVSRKVTGVLLLLLFSGGLALLAPMTFAQALLDLDPDRTAVEQIRQ